MRMSAGTVLCLGVAATLFFFVGRWAFPRVRPGLFDTVVRSAKAIEGSERIGLDIEKFRELLQGLSTELGIAKDRVKSNEERVIFNDFVESLKIYHASLYIWELEGRDRQLIDPLQEDISTFSKYTSLHVTPSNQLDRDTQQYVELRYGPYCKWRDTIREGWLPAFPVGVVKMPFAMKLTDLREIFDTYKLDTHVVSGYAFIRSDAIQSLWEIAREKVNRARRLIDGEN